MVGLDKEDKTIESIVEEYKMSMGGCFFNNNAKDGYNIELERLMIENGIENHLFDTHELLSIYDKLSRSNKREFFRKVVVSLINFNSDENKDK